MSEFDTVQGSGTALFVRRPILAFVLSALIVIGGLAGFFGIEVRELPNVDRPVVSVTTDFEGASPETVDQEVTGRIEGAVGRVAGVRSISSNSRFGRSRVTLEFQESVDIDVAATDVRDAVARIVNALPDDAEEPRVIKADADAQPIVRVAVTSAIPAGAAPDRSGSRLISRRRRRADLRRPRADLPRRPRSSLPAAGSPSPTCARRSPTPPTTRPRATSAARGRA